MYTNRQVGYARESNGELLRLICIFIIVVHHFCVHALYPEVLSLQVKGTNWDSHLLLFIHCFLYVGVDCFVLLSGWYGIKLRLKGFFNLWLVCALYAGVAFVGRLLFKDGFEVRCRHFCQFFSLSAIVCCGTYPVMWLLCCFRPY